MIRIAVVADSHFDESSRFEECCRIHDWIAENAAGRGCTLWLHAGDIYERRSTPEERHAAAAWVRHMADVVGPGVIVRGNHDAVGDLPLLGWLDTAGRGVSVVEDARVLLVGGVSIACLGWPQRGRLHALLPDRSRDEVEAAAGDALRAVLRGLGDELRASREDEPRLFLGHCMVRGSRTSTGQPLVGCDFELGLDDLATVGADAYLLGHIHLGQEWDVDGAPAVYPGSPRRTNFGELEPKGYLIVECDGHGVRWERVETPATKMVHVDDEWGDAEPLGDLPGWTGWLIGDGNPDEWRGAELRFRYRVASDRRTEAVAAAGQWRSKAIAEFGAASVKLEEVVIAEQRARAPEIARAATLSDKLVELWRLKGFEPGDRRDALLGKVSAIESEAAQ